MSRADEGSHSICGPLDRPAMLPGSLVFQWHSKTQGIDRRNFLVSRWACPTQMIGSKTTVSETPAYSLPASDIFRSAGRHAGPADPGRCHFPFTIHSYVKTNLGDSQSYVIHAQPLQFIFTNLSSYIKGFCLSFI